MNRREALKAFLASLTTPAVLSNETRGIDADLKPAKILDTGWEIKGFCYNWEAFFHRRVEVKVPPGWLAKGDRDEWPVSVDPPDGCKIVQNSFLVSADGTKVEQALVAVELFDGVRPRGWHGCDFSGQ